MNRRLKFVLAAVFAAVFCTLMALLLFSAQEKRREVTCTRMEVSFRDSLRFVSESDVRGYLAKEYGAFVGERIDSVRLWQIEEILETKSAVKKCQAWVTDSCGNGILHVSISQREPVIRFQNGEVGYYADERGCIFPLHHSYKADVPLVSGSIPLRVSAGYKGEPATEAEKKWLAGIIGMLDQVRRLKIGDRSVESMTVSSQGDIVLTLSGGQERFILGQPSDIADKFARIEKYFSHIQPAKGEGYYKTVNLKFNKQIICRKDT